MTSGSRQLEEFRDRLERDTVTVVVPTLYPRRREGAGDEYRVRAGLTARDWVAAALDDDPLALLRMLEPDDEDDLLDAEEDPDDPVTHQQLRDVGLTLLQEASGWRWWEAIHLIVEGVAWWLRIDGDAAGRGVDLLALPIDRYLNHVYAYVIRSFHEQTKLDEWLRALRAAPLTAPDRDLSTAPEWSEEEQAASWKSAASQVRGG